MRYHAMELARYPFPVRATELRPGDLIEHPDVPDLAVRVAYTATTPDGKPTIQFVDSHAAIGGVRVGRHRAITLLTTEARQT